MIFIDFPYPCDIMWLFPKRYLDPMVFGSGFPFAFLDPKRHPASGSYRSPTTSCRRYCTKDMFSNLPVKQLLVFFFFFFNQVSCFVCDFFVFFLRWPFSCFCCLLRWHFRSTWHKTNQKIKDVQRCLGLVAAASKIILLGVNSSS